MAVDEAPARTRTRRLPGATVLQIVPALVDEPAARAAVDVASALLRSGARALVAGGPGMLIGQLQALGGEWVQCASLTRNPIKLRGNARVLGELIARERIDVVHAYSGPAAWSARIAIHGTGALLVTTYAGAPAERMKLAWLYRRALTSGHRIMAESEHAADLVIKRHKLAPERIVAIPPSIDTARFDPTAVSAERTAVLRHGWGIRPGWRVILVPGRLSLARGQMTLVDAVRILVNGGMRGVAFILADDGPGDSEDAQAIAQRIEAQGIGGLVRRVGHCADMPAAYEVADLVVVPSTEPATFSQTAAEAHAMAKPVIASAIGALPEIVLSPPRVDDEDRTGWLVNPSDPIALARALAAALALDDSVLQATGSRARWLAETRFSPSRVAAAALAVYASLLENGG
jgi:glycosyltransferase involved in cell wall biosynthesis